MIAITTSSSTNVKPLRTIDRELAPDAASIRLVATLSMPYSAVPLPEAISAP